MTPTEYLVALVGARTAAEVLDLQAEFGESNDMRFLPIGGDPARSWQGGGLGYNNRGSIENMEDAFGAHYEAIMNGFDSSIDLAERENIFTSAPKTPAEALRELGQRAAVMVLTGRHGAKESDEIRGRNRRPKDRANVLTVDQGTGITADLFGATILSIMGNNKITNPLMAGSYGQGVKANFRFSENGVTLIYSRSVTDPNKIAFTVTSIQSRDNWKADSYIWQCNADGHALIADFAKIPSKIIKAFADVGADQSIEYSNGYLVIGSHGTGLKLFGLENFTSPLQLYNKIREIGFGMEVPVYYRNGIDVVSEEVESDETEDGDDGDVVDSKKRTKGTKRRYDIYGLRESLNSDRRINGSYPVIWRASDANDGKPIPILNKQATLEVWVVNRRKGKLTKTNESLSEPIRSLLSKDRWNSPIFVTLNGQTHKNLHTRVMFRSASLPYLDGYVIMEVNCDNMDAEHRRRNFTSNREGATRQMEEQIKKDIEDFLKEMSIPLGRINKDIRDRFLSEQRGVDSSAGIRRLTDIMNQPLAGAVFSGFGAPISGKKKENEDEKENKSVECKPVPLTGTPDQLEVANRSVEPGKATYISVVTNATNDYDADIEIVLPSFLKEVHRLALDDGKMSQRVLCNENTPIDTVGIVTVTLNRDRVNLPPLVQTATVKVVNKEVKAKPEATSKRAIPKFNPILVAPTDPRWEGIMDTTGIATAEQSSAIAFNVKASGLPGEYDVFINTHFPVRKHIAEVAGKKFSDKGIVERLMSDYDLGVCLMGLADEECRIQDAGISTEVHHRAKSSACKAQGIMLMLSLESLDKGRPATRKSDMVAEEAAA